MGLEMKYFVLNPRSKQVGDKFAAASRKAMKAYANHISMVNELLALELKEWATAESDKEERLKLLHSIGKNKIHQQGNK